MDTQMFVNEFNKVFGEPFLPAGFAEAKILPNGRINIAIGRRDGDFNMDTGENTGAGTCVGKIRFTIVKE